MQIIKQYRNDIDGLRAIAIIAIIINHINSNFLPSGYLGVDIFFVISGYLITISLNKNDNKQFKTFYTLGDSISNNSIQGKGQFGQYKESINYKLESGNILNFHLIKSIKFNV